MKLKRPYKGTPLLDTNHLVAVFEEMSTGNARLYGFKPNPPVKFEPAVLSAMPYLMGLCSFNLV